MSPALLLVLKFLNPCPIAGASRSGQQIGLPSLLNFPGTLSYVVYWLRKNRFLWKLFHLLTSRAEAVMDLCPLQSSGGREDSPQEEVAATALLPEPNSPRTPPLWLTELDFFKSLVGGLPSRHPISGCEPFGNLCSQLCGGYTWDRTLHPCDTCSIMVHVFIL